MKAVVLLCLLHAALAEWEPWNVYDWYESMSTPAVDPNADSACKYHACGCCVMLQKMNRLRTYFNTTLTELEHEYEETYQNLNFTKDKRVAFSASLFSDDAWKCYGPEDNYSDIPYKHVFLNLGEAYNKSSGIFTVPCSGVYMLAVTIYSDAGAPLQTLAACASLHVNGKKIAGAKDKNNFDQEDSANIVLILELMANDTVTVTLAKHCSLCDDGRHYNTFSAFLLYPID